LAYLTIYNPAFGETDETAYEQIFFYYSRTDAERQERFRKSPEQSKTAEDKQDSSEDEKNERLRQVGLARGVVEFAK
jgi:hypothetical protein